MMRALLLAILIGCAAHGEAHLAGGASAGNVPAPSGGAAVAVVQVTPPPTPPPAVPGCGQDEIYEMQCGGGCGATGEDLVSYGKTHVAITYGNQLGHDATLRGLLFDQAETTTYRNELAAQGLTHLDQYCCYSRCTQLHVTAAVARFPPKPGYSVGRHCLPAPASTGHPAAANPRCPAAVDLLGNIGGYIGGDPPAKPGTGNMWWWRSEAESCCYETYVKNIPPNFGHCPTCK